MSLLYLLFLSDFLVWQKSPRVRLNDGIYHMVGNTGSMKISPALVGRGSSGEASLLDGA